MLRLIITVGNALITTGGVKYYKYEEICRWTFVCYQDKQGLWRRKDTDECFEPCPDYGLLTPINQ